ncbi:hypothetical protein ACLBWS_05915 [Brucellaceae bacterium D45D]
MGKGGFVDAGRLAGLLEAGAFQRAFGFDRAGDLISASGEYHLLSFQHDIADTKLGRSPIPVHRQEHQAGYDRPRPRQS